jgi:hypothetical protein
MMAMTRTELDVYFSTPKLSAAPTGDPAAAEASSSSRNHHDALFGDGVNDTDINEVATAGYS